MCADGDVHAAVRQVGKTAGGDVLQLSFEQVLVPSLEKGEAVWARLSGGMGVKNAHESHVDVDDVLDTDGHAVQRAARRARGRELGVELMDEDSWLALIGA